MRTSRCLFNSATALRRVFLETNPTNPSWQSPPRRRRTTLFLPALALRPLPSVQQQQRRTFVRRPMIRHHQPQANNPAAGGKNALPRDFEIKSQFVQVRNEESGRLSEPQLTSEVLKGLDLQKYSLAAVVMPKPPTYGQEGGGGPMYPICRIVDKKAELNAQMEKAKAARKKAVSTKEVEINWAIAPHDLDTRLKRLKTFLGKGMHVELTLMKQKKRNKRQASADEAKEVMAKVKEAIEKISGTKEYKASEGTVGGVVRMFLKGPNDYVPAAAEGEGEEEE